MEIRIKANKQNFNFQTLCYTLTEKSSAKEQKERFFPLFNLLLKNLNNEQEILTKKGDLENEK